MENYAASFEANQSSEKTQHETFVNDTPQKESNDQTNIGDGKEESRKGTKLHLFYTKPAVRDEYNGILLNWNVSELIVSQPTIQKHVETVQSEVGSTIPELYQNLSRHEWQAIHDKQAQYPFTTLISVKRTYTETTHRGVAFKEVPGLQFGLEYDLANGPTGPPPPPVFDEELRRPTYIRVHRKHLSTRTLDAYQLPWEWDQIRQDDLDCMIIRRWLTEDDQDKLFEHTRKLRISKKGNFDFSDDVDRKDVITLSDPMSRILVFPFNSCNTWAVSTNPIDTSHFKRHSC
ncbi:MAG: hypothetical protein Q9178_007163 [Gyalolechia marmorata]